MANHPLKIVFYTDSFLPARDGVVSSILSFRKELMRRGHEVYIFASGDRKTKKLISGDKGISIINGMAFRKYPQYRLAILPFITAKKIREINPDIVHAHTPFIMGTWGLALGRINRIPVVGTFHTLFTDKTALQEYFTKRASRFLERYAWKYARFYYNRCDEVTAPSQTIKELLTKHGIRNVSVIPNGVDTERFNPRVNGRKLRRNLQKRKGEKIALYIGRMSKEKRLEVLIKAAKLLKDENIRFVFGGKGPYLERYKAMAARMKLDNVDFVGFVDDRQLSRYYAACDLFCMPSNTFETQGIVCLEAMAAGKPVVGADSKVLREVIRNGRNGERFKPDSTGSCAAKIKKVAMNIDSYKGMRDTAERYSIEKATDELLRIYQKAINGITV